MNHHGRVGDVKQFPILERVNFMDHASVAPLPAVVADAMVTQVRAWSTDGPQAFGYLAADRARRFAATLMNVGRDEIALVPNTSTGLGTVASGIISSAHGRPGLGAGDVVVTTASEFPSNRLAWELRRQDGCTVVVVGHDGPVPAGGDDRALSAGLVDEDAVIAAMRDAFPRHHGTRLLAISHVQFATGQRHDLAKLADEAHRLGGLICVDAIQSLGQVPFDARGWELDFVAADGHKWLLGPEGAGAFMVRREHLDRVRPSIVGWMSVPRPMEYDTHQEDVAPDASRYETGCYPVTNINGFAAALELILDEGIDTIAARLSTIADRLQEGLRSMDLAVVSPPFGDVHRGGGSGSVSFRPPEGHDAPTLMARLKERAIRTTARRGLLRLSPHWYMTEALCDEALEAIGELVVG